MFNDTFKISRVSRNSKTVIDELKVVKAKIRERKLYLVCNSALTFLAGTAFYTYMGHLTESNWDALTIVEMTALLMLPAVFGGATVTNAIKLALLINYKRELFGNK